MNTRNNDRSLDLLGTHVTGQVRYSTDPAEQTRGALLCRGFFESACLCISGFGFEVGWPSWRFFAEDITIMLHNLAHKMHGFMTCYVEDFRRPICEERCVFCIVYVREL